MGALKKDHAGTYKRPAGKLAIVSVVLVVIVTHSALDRMAGIHHGAIAAITDMASGVAVIWIGILMHHKRI